MNHHIFRLDEFEVDTLKALEALQCLVHTMIVVRQVGSCAIKPKYQECTTFPLTYASCDSDELSSEIDKNLTDFLNSLRRISPRERKGTIRICFSSTSGNSKKQSIFEEWQITVIVSDSTPPASTDAVYAETRKRQDVETMHAVRNRVIYIVKEAAAAETKLPDFSTSGTSSSSSSSSNNISSKGKKIEAFPYDLSLLYDGKIQKKKATSGFLSSAKSFASSWFG
jgi:hypothetical protein